MEKTYRQRYIIPRKRWHYAYAFVFPLLVALLVTLTPSLAISYVKDASLYEQMIETGGCVTFHSCPSWEDEELLKEMGGLYPPTHYEKDSWMWMRSTCTYSPNICK